MNIIISKFWKFITRILLSLLIGLGVCCCLALILDKLLPLKLDKYWDQSTILLDKQGELLSLSLASDERIRLPIQLEMVDPLFIRLLINYEDKRFYYHPGVDPVALLRALGQYVFSGRVISGGSTLTMQVARLLEPRPRLIKNKAIELLRAMQLEYHFSKKSILEMYLCLAPYGGNLEGIRAASLSYFAKEPKHVTPSEAALLAVLPQSPTRLRPDRINSEAKAFRDKLIDRMSQTHILTSKEAREAKDEPVPTRRVAFPKLALHLLAEQSIINIKKNETDLQKKNFVVQSTLNKNLQVQVERYLKSTLPFLESTQTAAAMVVDNETQEILVYVGSADFFSEQKLGQVDMIKAIRSPGSTLKPFIYGLGFEKKLLHPETIVKDTPMGFSGYAPSNFRDVFHGEVTIREALQQSLNIPAVLALEKMGPGHFCDWLNLFGVHLFFRDKSSKPTLPIALGGLGIRFFDLMGLYVALGNQGQYAALKLFNNAQENTEDEKIEEENKITAFLSKEVAWHLTKILQETHAPNGFVDNQFTAQSAFAYKTGTSYGYRDAWAIGYSHEFTIGVWVGKPDGSSSINKTGRDTAAPILFKILGMLPTKNQKQISSNPSVGHLSLKNYELPKNLRVLQRENTLDRTQKKKSFQIQFPKEGAVIYVDTSQPLHFILSGGEPPYYAFINGQPLAESFAKTDILWQPTQASGFVEFSVIDSRGQSDVVSIEVK